MHVQPPMGERAPFESIDDADIFFSEGGGLLRGASSLVKSITSAARLAEIFEPGPRRLPPPLAAVGDSPFSLSALDVADVHKCSARDIVAADSRCICRPC